MKKDSKRTAREGGERVRERERMRKKVERERERETRKSEKYDESE